MALFSRRPRSSADTDPVDDPEIAPDDAATGTPGDGAADDGAQDDTAPEVSISTSSFGGFGAAAGAAEPAPAPQSSNGEAPPPTETLPGLPDNVLLRDALAALGSDPEAHEIFNVARQLLQGNVYLRVKGDAQALLNAGEDLPLAVASRDDGQFVMLFSGGAGLAAAITADGDMQTSAMGQDVRTVLEYVLRGEFAGIVIDQASVPASVVLPRLLLGRAVEEMDPDLRLKRLLAAPRTDATASAVVDAMASAPLWVAVNRASDEDAWGIAESRTPDGERILDLFSHPLEVVALGRGDQPTPFTATQLATALASDEGLTGVVLDPGGPWIRLTREQLAPVIALAE